MSPPRRTRRTDQDTFTRTGPEAVTYDLSVRDQATIRVPVGSAWTSGPHWHDSHTEFLQVLAGRARVTLSGRIFCVGPADGAVTVPRGLVHEWRRADRKEEGYLGVAEQDQDTGADTEEEEEEEELVVREWTEPRDGAKEMFFRNLNGIILDATAGGGAWSDDALVTLELWNLFWRADNYPVTLGAGWVGGLATRAAMGVAVAMGWVLGRRGVYGEYGER
ncbi:hypothetical protein F5Y00DRAFT_33379 [Daldinia vernicosa]|uniref:uncharacterized protein n=1 Tax=Daldinia vernicosa TaxID=114800 RepID=UPI002007858B|nr:uncharacterized protein F5Y00DRAFT_33379 [Daldinia vernicosa]KAI0850572.1 hypothetical protein F5Y00DRAFT_33379 [Daldinia vernicosa]